MSISVKSTKSYYMFYKPVGCITAKSDSKHRTVMDYFSDLENTNLHPVGRLDKDTEGLLLITDDGHFNQFLMSPDNHVVKTYEFCAMGELTADSIKELEQGIYFQGDTKRTAPCQITITSHTVLKDIFRLLPATTQEQLSKNRPEQPITVGTISITEGRKHHVKRLIRHAGGYVIALKRISIGNLKLDENLNPGEYRQLTKEELTLITMTSSC